MVWQTSYVLKLRHGGLGPLSGVPRVVLAPPAGSKTSLHVLQLATQLLGEFRAAIQTLGGTVCAKR